MIKTNIINFPTEDVVTTEQVSVAAELKPEMNKVAGLIWDNLAPYMINLGYLKPHFVIAFAEYCYLLARIAETRKFLQDNGETYSIVGRNGEQIKSRPQVAQLNDDWRKLSRLTSCFGLTPSDEKSLINSVQRDIHDEWAQYKT